MARCSCSLPGKRNFTPMNAARRLLNIEAVGRRPHRCSANVCRGKDCGLPMNCFQSPQTTLAHGFAEAAPDHTGHIDLQQVNNSAFDKLIIRRW